MTLISITKYFTHRFSPGLMLVIMTLLCCLNMTVSVTGTNVKAATGEYVAANKDLLILLGNGNNGAQLYKEYQELEKSCEHLSIHDINVKLSHYFMKREQLDKGVMLLRIVISRYDESLSDEEKLGCANAYNNIGYYLIYERNNPLEAYPFLIKSLDIANSVKLTNDWMRSSYTDLTGAINTNIAKIFAVYHDYPKAMHYYKKAFSIGQETQHPVVAPLSFIDLLNFAWSSDSLSTIANDIRIFKDLKIATSVIQSMVEYSKLMADGAQAQLNKRYDTAMTFIDSARNVFDSKVDDRRYLVFNRIIAGKIAVAGNDYAKALSCLREADEMSRAENLEDMYDLIYNAHTELFLAKGDFAGAERSRNEALKVRDSLHNLQSYSAIRDMELSFQEKDYGEKLSSSHSQIQRWMYSTLLISLLMVIIVGLVVYILIKNRKLRKHSESLFRKNVELIEAQKRYERPESEPILAMGKNATSSNNEIQPENDVETKEEPYQIFDQILAYMASSPEIFKPSFTIETLAEDLNLPLKTVSQAINSLGGKNFNTLLAEFRIKKACEKMMQTYADPSQRPTIEVLAEEVGYKSRTHFMRVFKNVTGLTTSEFLKQAKSTQQL